MNRKILAVALLALSGIAPSLVRADGFIYVERYIIPRPPHPPVIPRPLPRPEFPLQVTRHRVAAEIDGNVSRTRVDETFHNPNPHPIEGVYLFPLPPGAAVSSFAMTMGGKSVQGEMLEKDKARAIYESIVRQMKDPGLLEYVERGLFRARVFPIPPGGGMEVRIEYEESLRLDHGHARYFYPLNTGKYSAGDYRDVLIDVRVRAPAPIRNLHCPSHPAQITRPSDREARVTFEASTLAADKDFILDWNVSEDELAPMLLTFQGSEPEGFFLLSLSPRGERDGEPVPKDLILAIDTSGSMAGQKMEDARKAIRYCISSLNPRDRFNIIDFSTEARRFREAAVEAGEENKRAALAYADGLRARGGTHIEEALRGAFASLAADDRLKIVCLITDGEPTLGLTRPDDLARAARELNRGASRVFAFGIGVEINTHLLEKLALDGRGAVEYVLAGEQLEVKLSNFYDKIDLPVLTDLRLEVPGLPLSDVYPRPLPDLFRGDSLLVTGRFLGSGRHTVVLRGKLQGKERALEHVLDFTPAAGPSPNEHIARTWATRKVGYLLEAMRLSGESPEVRDEVIKLSKQYGILTPYTSYLIIEDDARRPQPAGAPPSPAAEALRRGGLAAPEGRKRLERAAGAQAADKGEDSVEAGLRLKEIKEGKAGEIDRFIGDQLNRDRRRIQHAAGKTFYLAGERWVESTVEPGAIAAARRIAYLSDEYFALLRAHPGIGQVLSLGAEVAFRWGGELILIAAGES